MKNRISKGPFVALLICSLALRLASLMISTSPFAERAGELQALPPQVLDMAALASAHNIHQFDLSKVLSKDPAPTQRFIEFLYPIRIVDGASAVFGHVSESMPPDCRLIETKGDIVLYECTQH